MERLATWFIGVGLPYAITVILSKRLIDASGGRKTESVIITDSDHIVLSYLKNQDILERHNETEG